ncbi:hypothetical protein [Ohtaekwangia koreensis]|uniref:Uncharacterized protein n=1 Tax=Ohtaekwangia koreensis TaxID=688867 RepID=A0A1T5IP91_9BACT|nr:hypothetical protein [Ohtaekwangia koreensis]SKC40930.1 hypothetical protein SAMN05660236_0238 [Ohtaekwangia koreensis]
MKSLPEKDFWNNIKTRLNNYTEEPEDGWDDIAALISPSRYDYRKWMEFSRDLASAVVLILLLVFVTEPSSDKTLVQKKSESIDNNTISKSEDINGGTASKALSAQGEPIEGNSDDDASSTSRANNDDDASSLQSIGGHTKGYTSRNNNEVAGKTARSSENRQRTGPTNTILYQQAMQESNSTSATGEYQTNAVQETLSSQNIYLQNSANDSTETIIAKDSTEIIQKKTESVASKTGEAHKKKSKAKKFRPAVYFTVSPSLAYQKIVPVRNDAVNISEVKSDGIFSSNRMGFTLDGGFQVPVTKNLEAYIGASYYQQNQTMVYTYETGGVSGIEGNPDEDYIIKPNSQQKEFSYAKRNVGASAGFFYRLKTDKLMHKVGAGLQYQKGFMKAEEGDTYQNNQSSYFNYQILYRLELAINPRTNFYIQPSFTHAIHSKESLQEPFTLKPYRAAIGVGMIYRF